MIIVRKNVLRPKLPAEILAAIQKLKNAENNFGVFLDIASLREVAMQALLPVLRPQRAIRASKYAVSHMRIASRKAVLGAAMQKKMHALLEPIFVIAKVQTSRQETVPNVARQVLASMTLQDIQNA